MKRLIALLLSLLPAVAFAQSDISSSTGIIGNGKYLGAKTADGQATVPVLGVDASGNTELNCLSGKECHISVAKTPIAKISASGITMGAVGQQLVPSTLPAVITPMTDLTPVAGAALSARLSIIAAAAPTAAYVVLPAATANANKTFGIYSKSSNPVVMLLNGGVAATDSLNASAAATPYICAAGKNCDCKVIAGTAFMCISM